MVNEDEVIKMVRSCLLSVKGQISLNDLNKDYEALVGERIPYRTLGYSCLDEFMASLPGLEISRSYNGNVLVTASSTTSTQHLADMVSKQKGTKKPAFKPKQGKRFDHSQNVDRSNAPPNGGIRKPPPNSNYLGKKFDPHYNWKAALIAKGIVPNVHNYQSSNSGAYDKKLKAPPRYMGAAPDSPPEALWSDDEVELGNRPAYPDVNSPCYPVVGEPAPESLGHLDNYEDMSDWDEVDPVPTEARGHCNNYEDLSDWDAVVPTEARGQPSEVSEDWDTVDPVPPPPTTEVINGVRRRPIRTQRSVEGTSHDLGDQLETTNEVVTGKKLFSQKPRLNLDTLPESLKPSSIFPILKDGESSDYDCANYRLMALFAASHGYPKIVIKKISAQLITIYTLKVGIFGFERKLDPGITVAATIDALCNEAHSTLSELVLPIEVDYDKPVHLINRVLQIVYTMEAGIMVEAVPRAYKLLFGSVMPENWMSHLVRAKPDGAVEVVICSEVHEKSMMRPKLICHQKMALLGEVSSSGEASGYGIGVEVSEYAAQISPLNTLRTIVSRTPDTMIQQKEMIRRLQTMALSMVPPLQEPPMSYQLLPRPELLSFPNQAQTAARTSVAREPLVTYEPPVVCQLSPEHQELPAMAHPIVQVAHEPSVAQQQLTEPQQVLQEDSLLPVIDENPDPPRGLLWKVVVMNCISPTHINVRVLGQPEQEQYEKMHRDMAVHFATGPNLQPQKTMIGGYYAVANSTDGWYRARLISFNVQNYKVFLVDSGEVVTLNKNSLFILPLKFAKLPSQVHQVSLFGLDRLTNMENYMNLLSQRLNRRTFRACVLSPPSETPPRVTLHRDRADDISVNFTLVEDLWLAAGISQQLIEKGEARPYRVISISEDGNWMGSALCMHNDLLDSMLELLQQSAVLSIRCRGFNDFNPAPREMYLVFDDEAKLYRRAMVDASEAQSNISTVKMFLMDVGSSKYFRKGTMVPIRKVSEIMLTVPAKATRMILYVPPHFEALGPLMARRLSAEVRPNVILLVKLIEFEQLPKVEVSFMSSSLSFITLNDIIAYTRLSQEILTVPDTLSPVNIEEEEEQASASALPGGPRLSPDVELSNLYMQLSAMLPREAGAIPRVSDFVSPGSPTYPTPALSVCVTPAMPMATMPVPPVPQPIMPVSGLPAPVVPNEGCHFDVHVPLASNPGNFFVQSWNEHYMLERLMTAMQTHYTSQVSPRTVAPYDMMVGATLAAIHSDSHFYRVTILGPGLVPNSRMVQFNDFGEVTYVSVESLRYLEDEFLLLPAQAIRANLYGIKPIHQDWSVIDCTLFQELVSEREFVSIVMEKFSTSENPNEIKISLLLIDTSGEEDVRIDQLLVDEQKAVYCTDRR